MPKHMTTKNESINCCFKVKTALAREIILVRIIPEPQRGALPGEARGEGY